MYQSFQVDIGMAGIVSMIISGGTIISSFFSARLINRFHTCSVTIVSVMMTAIALFGISRVDSFVALCICAIPLGLGAGSVDAALNNFVALHYKASHMNWLHSFWGIGTIIGPIILSSLLLRGGTWRTGYSTVSMLQFALVVILILSIPLWRKANTKNEEASHTSTVLSFSQIIHIQKAKPTLCAFFCYCALEQTVFLWGANYLVFVIYVEEVLVIRLITLFFIGITLGRMLSGFLALKLSPRKMIHLGIASIALGVVLLLCSFHLYVSIAGLLFIGLGCAPIYPSLLHETPNTFGASNSQALMGIQMACAYVGSTFMQIGRAHV